MQLKYGYLLYRSVTFAQGAQRSLNAERLSAAVSRAPKQVTSDGCAYIVRVEGSRIDEAIKIVQSQRRVPEKAFLGDGTGQYEPYSL